MARILLLIPHPDDEIVGAATMIARRHAAGDRFFGLYLTSGVPAAEQLWRWDRQRREARVAQRRDEARAAAARLGIEPVGFSNWPSRTLKSHLAAAVAWIDRSLAEHAIDALWVAAWEGGHQDHDAANFLAAQTAGNRPILEFAEYNAGGGTSNWNRFAAPNGSETMVRLSPDEIEAKRALLAIYRSEKDNLSGVKIAIESCRPLPDYDYRNPPHDGKLWREAYHWVGRLMRHPRVDFEPNRALYAALQGFLNTRLSAAE
jgi:LmbE family N-acetylglucosaminyl deacetylase